MNEPSTHARTGVRLPPVLETGLVFLRLGCICFGGPTAHIGYFHREFVQRRNWLDEEHFGDLLALCQFLPGPASSQLGFAIGHKRAGLGGAFAAWTGFTLPSAVLITLFALGMGAFGNTGIGGLLEGLMLAAVAVVANAVWTLGQTLCPDRIRASMAILTTAVLLLFPVAWLQVLLIVAGGVAGFLILEDKAGSRPANSPATAEPADLPHSTAPSRGWMWLLAFFALLLLLPAITGLIEYREVKYRLATTPVMEEGTSVPPPSEQPGSVSQIVKHFSGFYQAGSLVFGGGHVVLPLLDKFTVSEGWVSRDDFLAGYGAAQALPGPLFAFSSFLGAKMETGGSALSGAVICLLGIYLPAWLLVLGVLPYWERLRQSPRARAALAGTNTVVVGLLLAAFYNPVWTAGIQGPIHLSMALLAFALIRWWRIPSWGIVAGCGLAGFLLLG